MEELDFSGLLPAIQIREEPGPIMLYAIGRNILKYHRFLYGEIKKYEGKKEQKAA